MIKRWGGGGGGGANAVSENLEKIIMRKTGRTDS